MDNLATRIKTLIQETYNVDVLVRLERPDPKYGDYATNVAMQLAKPNLADRESVV